MGHGLRARLQAIKALNADAERKAARSADQSEDAPPAFFSRTGGTPLVRASELDPPAPRHSPQRFPDEWEDAAPFVKKRTIALNVPFPEIPPRASPDEAALAVLIPDLLPAIRAGRSIRAEDFLFFDLETSGLSSGAGTIAFLAAFGRFKDGVFRLTQYLLLDYPGEADFLEAVLGEFAPPDGADEPPFTVTYNGKCFDSQILRTRCLMNGCPPPDFRHADLLHPARRLWKTKLPSCAQAEIETAILGLDRSGDRPGAEAPDIWFFFLKTGALKPLLEICDHNKKDAAGLAAIFAAFTRIARDPSGAADEYRIDRESLALRWRAVSRTALIIEENAPETGETLLREAAVYGFPKAALVLGFDRMKQGRFDEGRAHLSAAARATAPASVKAAALRRLAIDAERRLKDFSSALAFTREALALESLSPALRADFERRRERVTLTLNKRPAPPHPSQNP
jgi:uncharacterized protein YprB with RNaseH-like and TPR domain